MKNESCEQLNACCYRVWWPLAIAIAGL